MSLSANVTRGGTIIGRVEPGGNVYKGSSQVGRIQLYGTDVACGVYNMVKRVGSSDKWGKLQWPDRSEAGTIDPDGWVYSNFSGGILGRVEPTVPFLLMGGAALLLLLGGAEWTFISPL